MTKILTVQDLIHCTRCLLISCIFPPSISCSFSPTFYAPSISPNTCRVAVLEEGAHINIQDILTSSRKGSVMSTYLASQFGSLTSSVSIQSTEPRCFEPASGEVRLPNKISRSSVLEIVWFFFLQRQSLRYSIKKLMSYRAHNSILMGLLRQISQLSSFFPFLLEVNGRATKLKQQGSFPVFYMHISHRDLTDLYQK